MDEKEIPKLIKEQLKQLALLAKKQVKAEDQVLVQEAKLTKAKEALRELNMVQIPELMERLGLEQYKTVDGISITVMEIIRANITKANAPKAFEWLKEHGHGRLIKHTFSVVPSTEKEITLLRKRLEGFQSSDAPKVHAGTLSAFVREMLADGEAIPLELFNVFPQRVSKIEL